MKPAHTVGAVLLAACFAVVACSQPPPADPPAIGTPATDPSPRESVSSAVPSAPADPAANAPPSAPALAPQASAEPASDPSAAPPSDPAEPAEAATSAPSATAVAPPPAKPSSKPKPAPEATPASYSGSDPCTTTAFHTGQIRSACQQGGRAQAKAFMKSIVQKAKAAGTDLKCTSCHTDLKTFGLETSAVSDLKKWL